MNAFRTECTVASLPERISRCHKIFMIGSCFSTEIGEKLKNLYYQVWVNPFGVVFNPHTISTLLCAEAIDEKHIVENGGIYFHLLMNANPHSAPKKDDLLAGLNSLVEEKNRFLRQADWLIVTLGTAYVYLHLGKQTIVGNCHKLPAQLFEKKMLSVEEVVKLLADAILHLRQNNPALKVLITVSPVRHLRDGFIENNLSKGTLLLATQQLVKLLPMVHYFPAYELLMDDLRDYRFYADDMVHPGPLAVQYIWQKFEEACISPNDDHINHLIVEYRRLAEHRVLHKTGKAYEAYQARKASLLQQLKAYQVLVEEPEQR